MTLAQFKIILAWHSQTHYVTPEEVLSRSRKGDVVAARRAVAVELRRKSLSLAEVGILLGRKKHSVLELLRGDARVSSGAS